MSASKGQNTGGPDDKPRDSLTIGYAMYEFCQIRRDLAVTRQFDAEQQCQGGNTKQDRALSLSPSSTNSLLASLAGCGWLNLSMAAGR